MAKPTSNSLFKVMAFWFKIRDAFKPPENALEEAGIQSGFYVLDFGCGPGSYSLAAAEIVGETGKVYALDIHPLALQTVQNRASKKGVANIETISSDGTIRLADSSIDTVLLYDTFHLLDNPEDILTELNRVLRPNAILSFNDHHMKEDEIVTKLTSSNSFTFSSRSKRTYSFVKAG